MPRGDRMGPQGQGSGTGRGAGYCGGTGAPGVGSAPGWGAWSGGFGRGCRGIRRGPGPQAGGRFAAAPVDNPDLEREQLARRAKAMQAELEAINARLARLESPADQD